MLISSDSPHVKVAEWPIVGGGFLLQITLNKPKALNALTVEMIESITKLLFDAQDNPDVRCVLLDSEGEKAFCAGGDIVSIYNALLKMPETADQAPEYLLDFFVKEYRLDYLIHTFPKPIIAWGHGIIMGGGMGIFAGASHRIVTETTRIAMPEITIGLFPDVGSSFFLNKLPTGIALFMGLTGAQLNSHDAVINGLSDFMLINDTKQQLIEILQKTSSISHQTINRHLEALQHKADPKHAKSTMFTSFPDTQWRAAEEFALWLEELVRSHQFNEDGFMLRALKTMKNGSPVSACLFYEQLKRGKGLSLEDCFKMELNMAMACMCFGELKEGVRALLIDKDNQPNWKYADIAAVPAHHIEAHFNYFANRGFSNPLETLGGAQ